MNTLQKLFIEKHRDFIDKVIETGEVEHHEKDLAEVLYHINEEFGGKEITDEKAYVETDKPHFKGEQVLMDEDGRYIVVKNPKALKAAFKLILKNK